jgi:hypothetical protein
MKAFALGFLLVMLLTVNCTRQVKYVRHGEPCNSAVYDCVDVEGIK